MRRYFVLAVAALMAIAFIGTMSPAQAQFGKLKDKVKQKTEKEVDKKVDETLDGSGEKESQGEAESEEAQGEAAQPAGGTAAPEEMALYTKYDFIPGDKVIFFDDLSREEIGEFPSRWSLDEGVFEVAKQGNRSFILCTDEGGIRPRITPGPLPPKYTFEMDFWAKGPEFKGHWFHIQWMNAENELIGDFRIQDNIHTNLRLLEKDLASKGLPKPVSAGLHTMRIMATKTTMKCYLDNERVANVPAVDGFQPVAFRVWMDPWLDEPNNPMLIGNVRYAEGGKTLREQLDEAGRIVTHGILFDSGSDKIKAESYKTLADIGQLLTDDPALRLSIEGHTDSDGADEANLTLSTKRAEAVKTYLSEAYKVDGARLETKGWGEGKPIDTNDTAEGKANNRRVELVKL
jgi:OmpA-OmpF porin, OOP family